METLSKEYNENTIDNMIQALEYQREKLYRKSNDYTDTEWYEMCDTINKMIKALSL